MAISTKFRSLKDGDSDVSFSSTRFHAAIRAWQKKKQEAEGRKVRIEDCYHEIADEIHVTADAVKNWDRGNNGVGDMDTLKEIAKIMETDYKNLIVDKTDEPQTVEESFEPVGTTERDFLFQIYQFFVDYIYWFGGTLVDSYAKRVLFDPYREQEDYIWNLYHYLDRISLVVSDDTYMKLRKTITELENIITCERPSRDVVFPEAWKKANPILGSDDFELMCAGDCGDNIEDLLYCEDFECPEGLLHMLVEDMSDDFEKSHKIFQEAFEKEPVMEEGGKIEKRLPQYIGSLPASFRDRLPMRNFDSRVNFLAVKLEALGPLPIYFYVVKEFADTLRRIMKQRFPKYFGDVKTRGEK
ncbi:MAG: hypothetical protein K6F35_01565 [Lachnospiraceae bacterium]|nr:hypothetical protein [Lachnospiraceae bacterium]